MSDSPTPTQGSESFEDRITILSQELDLAIRWGRSCTLMVAYSSEYVRADSVSMLENFLMDRNQKVIWIHAGDSNTHSLGFWYRILNDNPDVVFFVDGLGNLENQHALKEILDQHSYLFFENSVRIVFWLTHKETSALAYQAPALWEIRSRFIELVTAPKPEQILQSALESAWQGTGEYNDQFEDTEAKISLRETILTELPKNSESTSMRANLLLTLGVLHWRKGDYEQAIETLHKALRSAANMQDKWFEAECFNALALVQASIGKHEEAIDSYKQAIKLAPTQIFAWNNLGNLCLKINRNHEALITFQKAIEHNRTDAIAWNGMGDVYSRSGYIDDAIAAYRKAIEFAPSLPHPWNGLGEVYARSGRSNDAGTAFQKAIELNDRFSLPWLGLARLHTASKHYRDAAWAYQHALTLEPKNSIIWNDLGCIYLDAGQQDDAVEAFTKAIEFERGFGWAYSNLALAYVQQEKPQSAIPLYLKSLDLLKDEEHKTITWNRLATAYRLLNEYENAIKAYQMADSQNATTFIFNNKPSGDETHALTHDEPAPVAETESAAETESTPMEERSEAGPIEAESLPVEWNPDDEEDAPYWVFESTAHSKELTAELFQTASQPEPIINEVKGHTMQLTIPFFTKAVAIEPMSFTQGDTEKMNTTGARAWNEKGNVLFREGAFEEATQAYNKAIKLDQMFGLPYCNLGTTYLHLGKYAEAILLLQKSLELLDTNKDRAIAWNELGNLYRCLNDYHNAAVAYQKADELDSDHAGVRDTVEFLHVEPTSGNARVWNELGDTFFKGGSYQKASDCYRKAAEMEPLDGASYNNLALSLVYQSRFEEALPLYTKSIELLHDEKEQADVWNRLGNVYRRLNDYDNAIAAYQNAVKLKHDQSSLLSRARFSLLGNCYVD